MALRTREPTARPHPNRFVSLPQALNAARFVPVSIPGENSAIVPVENSTTHERHTQFSVAPAAAEPSADLGRRALGVAEAGATEN